MKRRMYIVTRFNVPNCGSILQAIATQVFFDILGFETYILNYIPSSESLKSKLKNIFLNNKISFVHKIINCFTVLIQFLFFHHYQKKYLNLSKRFYPSNKSNLKFDESDIFCSGSDQLWGPINNEFDQTYFLSFTDNVKISFSSSIGRNTNLPTKFIKLLNEYKFISLREQSSVEYLTSICHTKIFYMYDPTWMIDKDYWLHRTKKILNKDKYIFYYKLHEHSCLDEKVKIFAKKHNLKIYFINTSISKIFQEGKHFINLDPYKFLSLLNNAECVFSDSFHCTVFSIIYKKKFISISPGITSIRILDILNSVGLQSRFQDDKELNLESVFNSINYDEVHSLLNKNKLSYLNIFNNNISKL